MSDNARLSLWLEFLEFMDVYAYLQDNPEESPLEHINEYLESRRQGNAGAGGVA